MNTNVLLTVSGTIRIGLGGTLTVNAGGTLGTGDISLQTGSNSTFTFTNDGAGTLTMGQLTRQTAGNTQNLVFWGSGNITVGELGNTGTGTVTKNGDGILRINGISQPKGTVNLNGGTIEWNNSGSAVTTINIASGATLDVLAARTIIAGTGTVQVDGTLKGGGTVNKPIVVNAAGILAPGASVGSLSTANLTLNQNAIFDFELDSSAALLNDAADFIRVSGDLNLKGTVTFQISDLAAVETPFAEGTTFSLFNYTGDWNGGLPTFGGIARAEGTYFDAGLNKWEIRYEESTGGANFTANHVTGSFVNIIAVPEPGTFVLVAWPCWVASRACAAAVETANPPHAKQPDIRPADSAPGDWRATRGFLARGLAGYARRAAEFFRR